MHQCVCMSYMLVYINIQNWEKIQLNSKLESNFASHVCVSSELFGAKIKEPKFN